MIIVLEGADGTGKTVLAQELCKYFGGKYFHATWSKELDERILAYHMKILSDAYEASKNSSKVSVIDRLWLSEAIYAEVFRQGSRYYYEAKILDTFINSIGGVNIICLADDLANYKSVFETLKECREEMYSDSDKMATVAWLYEKAYYGDLTVTKKEGYLSEIINGPGLVERLNYVKYSIKKEGRKMTEFISFIRQLLLSRRSYAHY